MRRFLRVDGLLRIVPRWHVARKSKQCLDNPKGEVGLAARLRKEMSMSLKWIVQWLEIGGWTYVSNLADRGKEEVVPKMRTDTEN